MRDEDLSEQLPENFWECFILWLILSGNVNEEFLERIADKYIELGRD